MGVLNFWVPRSQGVKTHEGGGEFGHLITKKRYAKLRCSPKYCHSSFFLFYCLAGTVSRFHRLSVVNAANNEVGSKIVIPLNLFEISEMFLFSIVTKEK